MLLEWPTLDLTDSSIAKVEDENSICGTDTTDPMQATTLTISKTTWRY